MARKARIDETALSEFGRWLRAGLQRQGLTLGELAGAAGIDESYLHKILKSYLPQYRQYRRPSYEKTVRLGRCLGDVTGAVAAAGYPAGERPPDGPAPPGSALVLTAGTPDADGMPQNAEDWPPELLEAMHFSQTLPPEVQRYIYGLWREQARVYAALEQSRPGGASPGGQGDGGSEGGSGARR